MNKVFVTKDKGGHMADWTCFKCGNEIDRGREYCAFDEQRGAYFHTALCPISYLEEEYEQGMVDQETMNQVSSID